MTATPNRRSPLLPLAILAVLLSVGFTVTASGVQWFWTEVPWVAVVLVVAGVILGALHFNRRARANA
jgi:hypothetical protein